MKTTLLASALRSVPPCLLAAFLLAVSPAVAAEGQTSVPGAQVSAPDPMAEEFAARVRDKAQFAASIAAPLSRVLIEAKDYYYRRDVDETVNEVIDALWNLRFTPALQKKWFDRVTTPAETERETNPVREFLAFMDEAKRFTLKTPRRPDTLWTALQDAARSLTGSEVQDTPAVKTRNDFAIKLATLKRWEKAFAQGVELADFAREAKISSNEAQEHAALFLRIKDNPEAVALALSILRHDSISGRRAAVMLRKLPDDIDAVRKDIADLEKNMDAEARYLYALHKEGDLYLMQMPLAAILPGAETALEKTALLPLSAGGEKPEKTLAVKRLARLVKDQHDLSGNDAGKDGGGALPFLREGERLFMVSAYSDGTPVFEGSALDAFADVGPKVTELESFARIRYAHDWRCYFVAAACGPEELAAHLASLSVMAGEREKSLFGPADEDAEEPSRHAVRGIKGDPPKDVPGETLRMTRVADQSLFLTLAPLADENGLARLMGPIKAVWARSYGLYEKDPWTEIRYSGKGEAGTLGESPVLKLDRTVLEALLAFEEKLAARAWANYMVREEAATLEQRTERYTAALADTEKRFADLNAKGFVSPLEKSGALYYLDETGDNTAKREKLQAILDDTSLSPRKRVEAMREALYAKD